MAEQWTRAFGRYLKTLRERRRLSLHDVSTLSQPFADKINKGYLSRCENGLQRLGFSKVIPLSKIYEVPADVLVERMELDMELDRVGGAVTEGKSFAELTAEGSASFIKGYRWVAYSCFRDAIQPAANDPVDPSYCDSNEQLANALKNCATAGRTLGKARFALHEFQYLETTGWLSARYLAILLDRISTCYRSLGQIALSVQYADTAIREAESSSNKDALGYLYQNRARLAVDQSDSKLATVYCQKAYRVFRETGRNADCVISLNNLAQCYFNLKGYRASRRTVHAAERLSLSLDLRRPWALSQLLLGELDELEGRPVTATRRWKEAADVARQLNDKELRFKAEFLLFRHALAVHDAPVARALQRRLSRLVPWMPIHTEEVALFKKLADVEPKKIRVPKTHEAPGSN